MIKYSPQLLENLPEKGKEKGKGKWLNKLIKGFTNI
jgi:hypothetical protein